MTSLNHLFCLTNSIKIKIHYFTMIYLREELRILTFDKPNPRISGIVLDN